MKYIDFINGLIIKKVSEAGGAVVFGQNVVAGSCISGLTKNIKALKNCFAINTPNCENTLCGVGFGLMMSGVSSVFFMKQQDFLLLGIDQLVNTYNFIRINNPLASFTIVPVVIDQGYQGLQSSLNNLGDFCSIARIPGFTVTNKADAESIISSQLVSPGFRIIALSQRLFGQDILEVEKIYSNKEQTVFQYEEGESATIVCFNFSLPYGLVFSNKMKEKGKSVSLFSVNSPVPTDWSKIVESSAKTKKIVVIDDSKSENLSLYFLLTEVLEKTKLEKKFVIKKEFPAEWLYPNPDALNIDYEEIVNGLTE